MRDGNGSGLSPGARAFWLLVVFVLLVRSGVFSLLAGAAPVVLVVWLVVAWLRLLGVGSASDDDAVDVASDVAPNADVDSGFNSGFASDDDSDYDPVDDPVVDLGPPVEDPQVAWARRHMREVEEHNAQVPFNNAEGILPPDAPGRTWWAP